MRRLAFGCLFSLLASAASACERGAPACETPMGSYHVALPDAAQGTAEGTAQGTVIFLHGAGGTSEGVLRMRGMIEAFTARGYGVLAPQGLPWREGRPGGIWSFLPEDRRPRARDERAFFDTVLQDAAARFELPIEAPILAGFSAGGFMVTYIACETPAAFAIYAPIAGGFWRPHPSDCMPGQIDLFHTHGWRDGTVPLEGRVLGGGRFTQGDIFEGMGLLRNANGCAVDAPSGYGVRGDFLRRHWECADGNRLEMALHPGGHRVPAGWVDMLLDWVAER